MNDSITLFATITGVCFSHFHCYYPSTGINRYYMLPSHHVFLSFLLLLSMDLNQSPTMLLSNQVSHSNLMSLSCILTQLHTLLLSFYVSHSLSLLLFLSYDSLKPFCYYPLLRVHSYGVLQSGNMIHSSTAVTIHFYGSFP